MLKYFIFQWAQFITLSLDFSCDYCDPLRSVWQDLALKFDKMEDVVIAEADCDLDPELCSGVIFVVMKSQIRT